MGTSARVGMLLAGSSRNIQYSSVDWWASANQ